MGIKSFTELKVYQATLDATETIYSLTKLLPPDELYGMVSQMKRAVISVGCNIAEGFGRRFPRDKANFYNIAFSSTEELKHLLRACERLKFLKTVDAHLLQMESISKMLNRLTDCVLGDLR
jgi:four helix bundle protein